MLHKRKRSATILSSATSGSESSNSVQAFYPPTKPVPSPFGNSKIASFDPDTPSYLNARTRKRYRDNRPDSSAIHAATIQKLYQAQQQHSSEPESQGGQQQQPQQITQQHAPTQKSTLHSFWQIPQPIPIITRQDQEQVVTDTPRCEDCDNSLRAEDAMDVDEGSIEDKACGSCRRPICDDCAVYGNERVCKGCAGCERSW